MARFDDEAIARFLRGRREVARIPFPGLPKTEVGVRILTDDQLDAARLSAAAYCKKRGADVSIDPEFFDRAVQREIVALAIVDPDAPADEPRTFFASAEDVRQLDASILLTLWQSYLAHADAVSPLRKLDESEVRDLVEALGKGSPPAGLLSGLDAGSLRRLSISLALALRERLPTSR